MADLVPYSWDWQQEYEEIRQELRSRSQYRRGGRPYPTELTNAQEIIETLERMVPVLKQRINIELEAQAVSAMEAVAATYEAHLRYPERQTERGNTVSDMPKTPAERQLGQLRGMQYRASVDADEQRTARFNLNHYKYCHTDCPYPDICRNGQYRTDCALYRLGYITPAPWWKQLVGKRFVPVYPYTESDCSALKQIRQSVYYEESHEERLKRIWAHACRYEPELCRHWAQEYVGRIDDICPVCNKSAREITGYRPSADPV